MSKQTRNRYSDEFKAEALKLAERTSVANAARELGIHESQIYGWRSAAQKKANVSERRGWKNGHRFGAPDSEWIEYHAVLRGRIYSGRCRLIDCPESDRWQAGSHRYLVQRRLGVEEVVWRRCSCVSMGHGSGLPCHRKRRI